MMQLRPVLLILLFCLSIPLQAFSFKLNNLTLKSDPGIEELIENAVSKIEPGEGPWRLTMNPTGQFWMWQMIQKHPLVYWDFGAEGAMEIAAGQGHRIWFGVRYRLAAGYKEAEITTPFDPQQIDSYQVLSYRYRFSKHLKLFSHTERFCFHEIDRDNSHATWLTHAGFGIGTISPLERFELSSQAWLHKKKQLGGYIEAGPFVHGGPQRIMGDAPLFQWETEIYLTAVIPLTSKLFLEGSARGSYLALLRKREDSGRTRLALRTDLIVQQLFGGFSLFSEYNLHDDYPVRYTPVGLRFGLQFRY